MFEKGERSKMGFVHEYTSRENVLVKNGVGVTRHGYICEESAQMVQLIDEEGLKFGRSKVNLERIARERTVADLDLQELGVVTPVYDGGRGKSKCTTV